MPDLSSEALQLILAKLAADPERAADEYLTLHLKLEKYFAWQDGGRRQPDCAALADETLDRVAKKLEEGVEIAKTVQIYALGIARFVWLEYLRKNPFLDDVDDVPEPPAPEPVSEEEEEDFRMACLRMCLAEVPKDDAERKLLLDYYRDHGEKLKDRRKILAENLDINTNALKVRMTRLREKVRDCIGKCLEKRRAAVTGRRI